MVTEAKRQSSKRREHRKARRAPVRDDFLFPLEPMPHAAPEATVLAQTAPIDGSLWQLSLHPFSYRRRDNPDLRAIAGDQSADAASYLPISNIFYDPAFLAGSRGRVERQTIEQLILWEIAGTQQIPHFSLPVTCEGGGIGAPEHYKALVHPFAPLGNPLQSDGPGALAADRLAGLLAGAMSEGMPPLLLHMVAHGSWLDDWLEPAGHPRDLVVLRSGDERRAAILDPARAGETPNKKRRRELDRLLRKLGEEGTVEFERAVRPLDVLVRLEEYLLTETRTWKGRRGTSIQLIKRHAAFARQVVMDLAREGRCRIYTMRLDGKPLASIIVFTMNGCYFPWKITFDENYARYSPGTQLMVRVTREIIAEPGFRMADSLARSGQSWMSSLWADEIRLSSYAIASDEATAKRLLAAGAWKARARQALKRLLRR